MENLAYLQAVLALESVEAIRESPLHFGFNVKDCVSSDRYRLAIALNLSLFSLMQAAVASEFIPAKGIGRGDSGPLVTCVQQMLKATGYFHGPVSGFYGPMTEQAVLTWELESAGVGDGAITATTLVQMDCAPGQRPLTLRPISPNPHSTPITSDRPIYDYGRGTLQRGDRGAQVVQLQQELIAAGYFTGPVTGYYGALTEDAVMHLQQDYHIPIDGVASAKTRLKLLQDLRILGGQTQNVEAIRESPLHLESDGIDCVSPVVKTPDPVVVFAETLRPGSQGSAVIYLQENLRNLGYYIGPITGYYGQLTEAAVMELQRDRRIHADGIAGPQTQSILVSLY